MEERSESIFESTVRNLGIFRITVKVREDGVHVKYFPYHLSFRYVPFEDIEAVEFTDGQASELYRGTLGLKDTKEQFERAKEQDGFTRSQLSYFFEGYSGAIRINRTNQAPIFVSTDQPRALAEAITRTEPSISLEGE